MSVLAFTGLPGSGKSYGVVEHVILPALRKGRTVVTNIPMNAEALARDFPEGQLAQLDLAGYSSGEAKFADFTGGEVFVLDELWRIWPAGLRANQVADDHKSFLAEHRHRVGSDGLTTEIVLVTQDLSQVAAFSRALVEKTYIAKKLSALGTNKRFRVDIYHGSVTGQRGPAGQAGGSNFGVYKPEVYQYYTSHTQGGGVVGIEARPDNRGTVWRMPIVYLGIPAAIIGALLVVPGFMGYVERRFGDADVGKTATVVPRKSSAVAAEAPVTRKAPPVERPVRPITYQQWQADAEIPLSGRWRLAAVVEWGEASGRGLAWIADNSGVGLSIQLNACKRFVGATHEYECVYHGERITSFSGRGDGSKWSLVDPRQRPPPSLPATANASAMPTSG